MENNISINKGFENYEQFEKQYLPQNSFDEYYQNYDYNTSLNQISPYEQMMFNIYHNNNIMLNNNSDNFKFENYNREILNDDYILNQNNIRNKNYNNNEFNEGIYYKNKNYSIDEDKKRLREEERQKKLKYQLMLDEQIREKRIREEQEREKKLKEDLFYEEKFRLEQQQIKEYQNEREIIKNTIQKESLDNPFNIENYHYLRQKNIQNLNYEDNFMEQNKEDLEQEYSQRLMANISQNNNNENNNIYNNIYQQSFINNKNQNPTPPTIENLVSTSSQMPLLNINRINSQGYKTQNYYYPNYKINNINNTNNPQSQNYFISQKINPYMTQNKPFDYQHKIKHSLSEIPTNISVNPINYQIPVGANRMMNSSPNINMINSSQSQFGNNIFNRNNSQNINELFNMNINNQNYIGKMMEIFFNEQNKIIESYKETIRQLKNERDEALIKGKANEEKLKALQNIQNCQKKIYEKFDYNPFKDEYKQDLDNFLSTIQKDELNINNQKENNISILSDSKLPPLLTSTKLVKPNSNEELLETWKKEEKENGKKLEFNGMDTNYMMDKISQIKNTILEKSNTNINNNLNQNNCMIDISLISKTNEDKSNEKSNEKSNNNNNINNNELGTETEFHIENNEDNNINNEQKNEEFYNDNDSVEILTNRNFKDITINEDEEKKSEIKNNIIINEKQEDNSKNKNKNINSQKSLTQSKNKYNNLHLFNIDNNISSSTQLKQRELYLKQNKPNINSISNNKLNKINYDKDDDNCLLSQKEKEKEKEDDIINYKMNNIELNNKNDDEDENNDFPNTDSPKDEFHTIQTFNPNNFKNNNNNNESKDNNNNNNNNNIKNKEIKNKEEQEIMKQMTFFDENSILKSNIKLSKNKKENNNIKKINENNINNNNDDDINPSSDLKNSQINSLNNLYNEYKKKKDNDLKDSVKMDNSNKESSILEESLNTFTQNLNIKWKNIKKNDINDNNKKQKDDLYDIEEDKKDDFEIFNKVNQFTRLANDELEQSQLVVFNKDNTINKFDEIKRNNH